MTGLNTEFSASLHRFLKPPQLMPYQRLGIFLILALTLLVTTSSQSQTLNAAASTPSFIDQAVINASLQALRRHGADLSKAMPSHHRVECESLDIATDVSRWAQGAGFTVSEPLMLRGHGGVPIYAVNLTKVGIPNAQEIQQQGLDILDGVAAINGATYVTWTGEIIR